MRQVTKEEFYKEVNKWGKINLDPMPERSSDLWVCQKTRKILGKSISKHKVSGKEHLHGFDYYLA